MIRYLNSEHVQLKMTGRDGHLVYKEKDREIAVYIEMSGSPKYDFLVWLNLLKEGKWSDGKLVSNTDFEKINSAFRKWAEGNKIKCQW